MSQNTSGIKEEKDRIVKEYGGWTAHNIDLDDGIYTINEKLNYDTLKLRRVIQIICDISDEKIDSLRILDLGSLEGLYTIELGLRGANVVAIEGREANLKKAEFSKDVLKIDNIQFFQDDVKNLSEGKYGRFDVILCLGLLYHLDTPAIFHLLENIYKMCDGFLIIDTNITSNSDSKADYRGLSYFGAYTREFRKGLSKDEKIKRVWNALDNERSFLFSKKSLLRILSDIGFTSVYECHVPFEYVKPKDRLTILAIKGKEASLNTYPHIADLKEGDIRQVIFNNYKPGSKNRAEPMIKIFRLIKTSLKAITFRYCKEE